MAIIISPSSLRTFATARLAVAAVALGRVARGASLRDSEGRQLVQNWGSQILVRKSGEIPPKNVFCTILSGGFLFLKPIH